MISLRHVFRCAPSLCWLSMLLFLPNTGFTPARHLTALVVDGVTVIDVRDGHRLPNQRVIIIGNRIQAMGAGTTVPIPAGAQIVDGRGKYLIPGLWDMHTHSRRWTAFAYPLFLATGVTGIRDAWSEVPLDTLRRWRREILAGTRVGPPRQLFAGAALDDKDATTCMTTGHLCLAGAADARQAVDSLKAAGADFIKTYGLSNTLYFVIAAEARRIGIPFGGHLGDPYTRLSKIGFPNVGSSGGWNIDSASVIVASDSGASILDHWNEAGDMATRCFEDVDLAHLQTSLPRLATVSDCQPVAEHFQRNGTWLVPTFTTGANDAYQSNKHGSMVFVGGTYLRTPTARALMTRYEQVDSAFHAGVALPSPWSPWLRAPTRAGPPPDSRPVPPTDTTGLLVVAHQVRLPILAGTDLMLNNDVDAFKLLPGFSLHTELALYVAEGLTPLEALQSTTLTPAQYLHATDSLGTIAPGKLADLVLLDADPLTDITNTTAICAVVANGRYYDRTALEHLLADAQTLLHSSR